MSREKTQDKWYPTRPNGHSDIVMVQQDRVKWMPAQLPAGVDLHLSDFARALQVLGLNKEAVVELVGRKKKESDRNIPNMQPGAGEVGAVAISALRDDLDDELDPEGVVEREYLYQIFVDKVAIEHQVNGLSGEQMLEEIARLVDEQIKKGLIAIKKEKMANNFLPPISEILYFLALLNEITSILFEFSKIQDPIDLKISDRVSLYILWAFIQFVIAKLVRHSKKKSEVSAYFPVFIAMRCINIFYLAEYARDWICIQRVKNSMTFSRRHRE